MATNRVSWIYLLTMGLLWAFVRFLGDRWWIGTLVLFGPLWVTLLPGAVLAVLSLFFCRRALWVLAPALFIGVLGLVGFCIPWRAMLHSPTPGQRQLRIMTCNIHGSATDKATLSELIGVVEPDVVLLQEYALGKDEPILKLEGHWWIRGDGELLIASRYPIEKVVDLRYDPREFTAGTGFRYDLKAPGGAIHVFNIHLASPHLPFQAVIDGDPRSQQRLEKHLGLRVGESRKLSEAAQECGPGVVLAGDFNTLAAGQIYHAYWSDFQDAFSVAGFGVGHTYFGEGAAVRIDHVMTGSAWKCTGCRVLPPVGSPHRPLVADFEEVK